MESRDLTPEKFFHFNSDQGVVETEIAGNSTVWSLAMLLPLIRSLGVNEAKQALQASGEAFGRECTRLVGADVVEALPEKVFSQLGCVIALSGFGTLEFKKRDELVSLECSGFPDLLGSTSTSRNQGLLCAAWVGGVLRGLSNQDLACVVISVGEDAGSPDVMGTISLLVLSPETANSVERALGGGASATSTVRRLKIPDVVQSK